MSQSRYVRHELRMVSREGEMSQRSIERDGQTRYDAVSAYREQEAVEDTNQGRGLVSSASSYYLSILVVVVLPLQLLRFLFLSLVLSFDYNIKLLQLLSWYYLLFLVLLLLWFLDCFGYFFLSRGSIVNNLSTAGKGKICAPSTLSKPQFVGLYCVCCCCYSLYYFHHGFTILSPSYTYFEMLSLY